MSNFSGTWALPLWAASGTTSDGNAHGYSAEFALPLFEADGSFEIAYNGWSAEWRLPLFEKSGDFAANNTYTGEWVLPFFQGSGEHAAGSVFSGAWALPLWEKSGVTGSPFFSGSWSLPLFQATGRFEAAITATFRGWPVNLKNAALTEYDSWAFNSLAFFNGEYLAAGDDGIFALSGDDDDGEDIEATVRLALSDLGVENVKRLPDVYLSYRSAGELVLRVVVDGGLTYEYPVEPTGKEGMYTVRAKVGKGLQSNYWCFEFSNRAGAAFDLDAIRARPEILSRIVGGR